MAEMVKKPFAAEAAKMNQTTPFSQLPLCAV
jgi:hypothetical protein